MANTQKHSEVIKDSSESSDVTPAGGQSDADTVKNFMGMLNREGRVVVEHKRESISYGELALTCAIPTAITVGGIIGMVGVLTLIDNKWGNGARANKLIDAGIERVSVKAGGEEVSVGM